MKFKTLDLLFKNGTVVDGSGAPWIRADVGIRGARILAVGTISPTDADVVLDATGLVICPGFVDVHAHDSHQLLQVPTAETKICQGITTMVDGNCGMSAAPFKGRLRDSADAARALGGAPPPWSTLREYFGCLEAGGMSINVASFVGNSNLRGCVLGLDARTPAQRELDEMRDLVAEAMEHGALGVSTGLVYPPSAFSTTAEIVALCKVAAQYGGLYSTHIRGMAVPIFEALDEALQIAREANLPLQLSHLDPGPPTQGRARELFARVEHARSKGMDVTADTLVYIDSVFSAGSLLPSWAGEGGVQKLLERLRDPETRERIKADTRAFGDSRGGSVAGCLLQMGRWDKIRFAAPQAIRGLNLAQVAQARGAPDPFDALLDVILESEGGAAGITEPYLQADIDYAVAHPLCMIETDGGPTARGKVRVSHTREYGTFGRLLGEYVRERGILPLEEAIRKSTSLPAQRVGLWDRGLIRQGMAADITVFNPATVADRGTNDDPEQYPTGFVWVLVNGEIVLDRGVHTGALPGKVLRRRG